MRNLALGFLLFGCAAHTVVAATPPMSIVVAEPAAPAPVPEEPVVVLVDAGGGLPESWDIKVADDVDFAGALEVAERARRSFERLGLPADAGPATFQRANAALDVANRAFAAAYHARDAAPSDQVRVLIEAGEMLLAWAKRLDDVGIGSGAFRTDPSVALTFEDVVHGPARRWRAEGLALIHLCHEAGVPKCGRLFDVRDGGALSGCGCDPGDPMCSASMSGWCKSPSQ